MSLPETIVVIGAGVVGLSVASCIQQHLQSSQSVLLVAREFPSDTSINYASPWAGAHYRPVPGTSPQALREAMQAQRTYRYFQRIAADEPAAGVQTIPGVEHLEAPPPEYLDHPSVQHIYGHLDGIRFLDAADLPLGVKWGTKQYTLAHINEAFTLADNVKTVVNCSGMGFADPKVFPIRGQTCLVRNPVSATITRQNLDGSWSFCIPRPLDGGTIIGGTKQPHDWDPTPSPETRAQLLANAAKWFPFAPDSGGQFDVVRDIVGRRPAREGGMRLEVEPASEGKSIVHAYGAGGRGFELSHGVAEDVTGLMLEHGLLAIKAVL
ncbi:D-amino-acid oxidase [Penicillium macrosclerotiorum]|uniref:D-amino-acid oxidase n=1 Tax=Penicillium macrosclerotiorum TaxID=303699 RepID=UPI00254786CC|nr:D-amino-acid oxidase [Penicillium macrosclerotiorum]KAJ5690444.1 D-amino-acid oxidase [Penicillium macrosclerotiorum]